MKVLRITSVFETPPGMVLRPGGRYDPIGGMQTHTSSLTRALDRIGVTQTVITTRAPQAPHEQSWGRHAVVHRVGVPVPRLRQGFAALAAPLVMRKLDAHDVVHVHVGEDVGVLALTMALLRGDVPVVVTVHTSLRHTLRPYDAWSHVAKHVGGMLELHVKRGSDAVIALTRRAADLAVADGADPLRTYVIPSGFDATRFARGSRPRETTPTTPIIGFLGRLHPQKDVEVLLRAAQRLCSDAEVVIVGDGPDRKRLERLATDLRLDRRVRFAGAVPHEQVPAVLHNFDVLAVPSRYEELGSVAVEAMAAGVPVVATRTDGLREVVRDGETGFLVPRNNPIALARALDQVVLDRAVRARLSRTAREQAARYSWDRLAERLHVVYTTITGECVGPDPGGAHVPMGEVALPV